MIGRLFDQVRFWLARIGLGDMSAEYQVSEVDLIAGLACKRVAIVGNSRALAEQAYGAEIDRADIVIRINRAPMPGVRSHGQRTDWLALATSLRGSDMGRIQPERILWMSPKRKRLQFWMTETKGFYLHSLGNYRQLSEGLKAPPTTGLMVIDLVSRSKARVIDIYGFDFFASLSLTGSRTADQVPHEFGAEQAWVENLTVADARVTVNR